MHCAHLLRSVAIGMSLWVVLVICSMPKESR